MSYAPFDAGSAVQALFPPAGMSPGPTPHLEPVGPEDAKNPMDNGQLIPEGPGDRAAGEKMRAEINSGIVNPLLGVWNDFKSGLPVAGAFVGLFVLFLVGLVMVFLGTRGGESFIVQGGGVKNAGV
jgi:hypothetical protein